MLAEYYRKNILRLVELAVILSILVSGYVLFAYERKQHNSDYQKNWVAFYFINPNLPENGVIAENHLGRGTNFKFCLVPDNDNLMEPGDLSCNADSAVGLSEVSVPAGGKEDWQYKNPENLGKYWVVLEYRDGDVLRSKNLSFSLL